MTVFDQTVDDLVASSGSVNVGDKAGHDVGVKTSQSWMI